MPKGWSEICGVYRNRAISLQSKCLCICHYRQAERNLLDFSRTVFAFFSLIKLCGLARNSNEDDIVTSQSLWQRSHRRNKVWKICWVFFLWKVEQLQVLLGLFYCCVGILFKFWFRWWRLSQHNAIPFEPVNRNHWAAHPCRCSLHSQLLLFTVSRGLWCRRRVEIPFQCNILSSVIYIIQHVSLWLRWWCRWRHGIRFWSSISVVRELDRKTI